MVVVAVLVMSSGNTMNTNTSPAVRGQLPNNAQQQQPRLPGQFTNTAILANLLLYQTYIVRLLTFKFL